MVAKKKDVVEETRPVVEVERVEEPAIEESARGEIASEASTDSRRGETPADQTDN